MILVFLLQSRPAKRGPILSPPGARGNMDPPDPYSPPLLTQPQQQLRTWTAADIPTKIDVTVTLEALHMWPIVFTRIMQLLGRSYRFVVTRSTEAQKYLSASDVAADDATEALWMKTYGELNRDRLEHAVYTLIQAAWDYPGAKVHLRTITPQDSRCAHAIFQKRTLRAFFGSTFPPTRRV